MRRSFLFLKNLSLFIKVFFLLKWYNLSNTCPLLFIFCKVLCQYLLTMLFVVLTIHSSFDPNLGSERSFSNFIIVAESHIWKICWAGTKFEIQFIAILPLQPCAGDTGHCFWEKSILVIAIWQFIPSIEAKLTYNVLYESFFVFRGNRHLTRCVVHTLASRLMLFWLLCTPFTNSMPLNALSTRFRCSALDPRVVRAYIPRKICFYWGYTDPSTASKRYGIPLICVNAGLIWETTLLWQNFHANYSIQSLWCL